MHQMLMIRYETISMFQGELANKNFGPNRKIIRFPELCTCILKDIPATRIKLHFLTAKSKTH